MRICSYMYTGSQREPKRVRARESKREQESERGPERTRESQRERESKRESHRENKREQERERESQRETYVLAVQLEAVTGHFCHKYVKLRHFDAKHLNTAFS